VDPRPRPARDYPHLLSVETTSRCNARCAFCPNSALTRPTEAMSRELFEKIIDDCTEFPLPEIEPFLQGDPFSDPHIMERLAYIRRRLPGTLLRLYTNGYGLTPRNTERLIQVGVDALVISLNTLDPQRYHETMGIKLDRTLKNIDYLLERRDRLGAKIQIRMTRLDDTSLEEQDAFLRYCGAKDVEPYISGLFNYKGDIGSSLPVPRYGCQHVTRLVILADGSTSLCCMDHEGDYGWGNAAEMSVLELYHHDTARLYRAMHAAGRRREIEPCGTCNMFWPTYTGTMPVERVRTGVEFVAYRVRHRPTGRKAPTSARQRATLPLLRQEQEAKD
jgi:molybdenum cofactor biosynthesis enzyme MoaA